MKLGRLRRLLRLGGRNGIIERTGFLVHTRELLNHFAPVWDCLCDAPFDVVQTSPPALRADDLASRWNARLVDADDVQRQGKRYRCLVSNHPVTMIGRKRKIPLIKAIAMENIRFMYAAGKSGWNLSDWNRFYDGILCFGPYHEEAFKRITTAAVRQMGYPRFDRFFTETPDRCTLAASHGCDPDRQTLVWLPTWKTLSSVTHFDAEIAELAAEWNVVVKVHPLMPESEPERVAGLKDLGLSAVIDDASDNVPLYQLADFMLFDYGGPPFAGIYTGKRFVLLNVPGAAEDPLMGPDSPDQLLREDFANVDPGLGGLAPLLKDDSYWDRFPALSERWRTRYFAPLYGNSSQVAAEAILNRDWLKKRES